MNEAPLAGNAGVAAAHEEMRNWAETVEHPVSQIPNRSDWRAGRVRSKGDAQPPAHVARRARKAISASGDVALAKRARVLLPSAREVFAVRIVNQEGQTRPWPAGFTMDDLHRRLQQAGRR